ncbi:hypothetical protein U3516DRAFT_753194 [Neocallimastix sp. 'constans']
MEKIYGILIVTIVGLCVTIVVSEHMDTPHGYTKDMCCISEYYLSELYIRVA